MIEQFLLHLLGDYIVQNDWMALNKKLKSLKGELACQVHCITYSLPFLFIASPIQVVLIYASHYLLDRFNFVGHFLKLRNGAENTDNFGFGKDRPFAITIWLYIITDNCFHLFCNYFILKYIT